MDRVSVSKCFITLRDLDFFRWFVNNSLNILGKPHSYNVHILRPRDKIIVHLEWCSSQNFRRCYTIPYIWELSQPSSFQTGASPVAPHSFVFALQTCYRGVSLEYKSCKFSEHTAHHRQGMSAILIHDILFCIIVYDFGKNSKP